MDSSNTKTITGKFATAKIFAADCEKPVEDYAAAQIRMLCDNEVSKGSTIRIMPDVHPGKVGTIGLTMTIGNRIMPNLIGIDIGCGMSLIKIRQRRTEFQKLDTVIRDSVPSGFSIRREPHHYSGQFDFSRLYCSQNINENKASLSLGTLGGGNHFIEVDKDAGGNLYVIVHSGSRRLGKEVTEFYLNEGQKALKAKGMEVPYELTYLEGDLMDRYLHDQKRFPDISWLLAKHSVGLGVICMERELKTR